MVSEEIQHDSSTMVEISIWLTARVQQSLIENEDLARYHLELLAQWFRLHEVLDISSLIPLAIRRRISR